MKLLLTIIIYQVKILIFYHLIKYFIILLIFIKIF